MGRHFTHKISQGFTIVETMLVLAVTGVLIVTLLVGVGGSINAQRYMDSVVSLKSMLQDQYAMVNNVTNDRQTNVACGTSTQTVSPGQSDCVLLGRYLSITGGNVTTATIVGYSIGSAIGATDVATVKANYQFGISTSSIETKTLEWGSRIAWPVSGSGNQPPNTTRNLTMIVIRSPQTGTSYTFTSDSVSIISDVNSALLTSMMVADTAAIPGQAQRTLCVEGGGSGPEVLAVYIDPAASGPTSIETRSYATIVALGGDSKC
jgi:type II secretory pathway pseudopilin PulG